MTTVLYVDDSADDLFVLSKACRAAGVSFRLKLADGADVAREYFEGRGLYVDRDAHPLPQLVLLDVNMPAEDGFELLNWLRSEPRTSDAVVAIYSGSRVSSDVQRAYALGAAYYLSKPRTPEEAREIATAIDEYLDRAKPDCSRLQTLSMGGGTLV